jgi:hypothetical protein
MAKTGRYYYCPMAGKINRRSNRKTLREWLISKLKRKDKPDLFMICDYHPAYYPAGYKK